MHSRRSLIASAVSAFALPPAVARMQSPEPNPVRWPTIQGAAMDQERTRLVDGPGLSTQPDNIIPSAQELEFVRTREHNPSMLLSNDVLLSRAMGPDLPLVATDARTGQELWRRNRVSMLLGTNGNTAVYVVNPPNEGSLPILKASRLDIADDKWAMDAGEIHGGIIINNHTLVYTQSVEDVKNIIARDITNGRSLWINNVTGFGSKMPSVFASNGMVIIGVTEPTYQSIIISAWSVDSGDLLWELDHDHFLSSPAFLGDDVVVLAADGLHRLNAMTGEELSHVDVPNLRDDLFTLAVTEEAAIILNYSQITSISWQTGEVLWTRPPLISPQSYDFLVCDGVIYNLEQSAELSNSGITVRGYSIEDGELYIEYAPVDDDGAGLGIAAFLVANGHLYLTTDQGICTVPPSETAISPPVDPVMSRTFANTDLGFSYNWDDNWTSIGTSFMTTNGQAFNHNSNGAVAAQSAGEAAENDYDFSRNWHSNLGPDDRYIRGINPTDAPPLDFVPDNAEVLGAEYLSNFNAPYDVLFGIRVMIPLADDNVLTFELLQAKSLFDDSIESFATFFENIEIG